MTSVQDWRSPKPNSGRRCLLCGEAPAGLAHIKVSWFRGDDEVKAVCKKCRRLPNAEEMLTCDHVFRDTKFCVNCRWEPPASMLGARPG